MLTQEKIKDAFPKKGYRDSVPIDYIWKEANMEKGGFHTGLIVGLLVMGFLLTGLILEERKAIAATPDWWKGSPGEYNQLVSNAEKEGQVQWIDSTDEEGSTMIIQAFNKLYPKIKVEQVRAHGLDSREVLLREL